VSDIRGHCWRNAAENLPPFNSIVLEREQVERFNIVARPYEVKADEC
jgi:hypothetical protein